MGKPEILRQRLIENPKGVREMHATLDFDLAVDSHAPGGAGKVAEPINRHDDCLIERRDVEC